jgi:hypothetical protein
MRLLINIIILFISGSSISQNTGYLGKKNVIDINFVGNYVLLPNMFQKNSPYLPRYKNEGGQLVEKKDRLDYGAELNFSRALSRRFGLGFCAGFDNFSVGLMHRVFNYQSEMVLGKHEQISVNGIYFLPTVSFAHKAGALPMGIVHQIGIGYRIDKPVVKDYLFDYEPNTPPSEIDFVNTKLYNFDNGSVNGVPVFYSVLFRYPISDFLFINAGMRYMMTFQDTVMSGSSKYEEGYFHNDVIMKAAINSRRRASLMKGFIGISLVF